MTPERFWQRPGKKETLAIKQEEKIRRWRLTHLRGRLSEFSPQWWVGAGEVLLVLALFLTNLFLLYPFFGHEDKYNVFSAPVIPLLTAFTDPFISYPYGVRIWLLTLFLIFPLAFYYFIREISGRKLIGLLSSFVVILPIGIFLSLRVNLGLLSGDGAHIASFTFIPLVCLLLLRFLRQGNFWAGIFSALGTTLVALTSPLGLVVLAVFMGIITFSEMLLGRGRLKMMRFFVVFILMVGFSAFWYNRKFVILTFQSPEGQLIKQTFINLLPPSFFLLPLLGVFGFLLFENRPQLQPMFIAFFLTVCFGLFSLGAGVEYHSPSRFLPSFGISLAFLLGISTVGLFDFLRTSTKLERFQILTAYRRQIAYGLIGLLFAVIIMTIGFSGPSLWQLEKTQVLGLATAKKVGLWEIKEQTSQAESIFGYSLTVLSLMMVGFIQRKLKQV